MNLTLEEALEDAVRYRWYGLRSIRSNVCQSRRGITTLEELFERAKARQTREPLAAHVPSLQPVAVYSVGRFDFPTWIGGPPPPDILRVADVTRDLLKAAVTVWQSEGTKPSTIGTRLNCLSAIGVNVTGCRPKIPNKLKWWLSPKAEAELLPWLRASIDRDLHTLADYIVWATRTGCRIEETLRLEWSDVHQRQLMVKGELVTRTLVTVQGLKTLGSQATLIITEEAVEVLTRRKAQGEAKPFDISYRALRLAWTHAAEFLGETIPYKATLKALRRNAARSLHTKKGMPLDMVRQYLRHGNVKTTMGYLRLTGGYGEEEMAEWL